MRPTRNVVKLVRELAKSWPDSILQVAENRRCLLRCTFSSISARTFSWLRRTISPNSKPFFKVKTSTRSRCARLVPAGKAGFPLLRLQEPLAFGCTDADHFDPKAQHQWLTTLYFPQER